MGKSEEDRAFFTILHATSPVVIEDLIPIFIKGVRIDGPVVTATDLLVSYLCLLFAFRLHRSKRRERAILFFKIYFLGMGLATLWGGIVGHAFLYAFSWEWKLPGWFLSMIAVMFVERASIEHTATLLKPKFIRILRWINIVEFLLFSGLVVYHLEFIYVEIHLAYGMLFVVASLELLLYFKTKNPSSKNMAQGVLWVAGAAFIFMNKIQIHPWINHMTISHLLMAVAAYYFYLGAKHTAREHPSAVVE